MEILPSILILVLLAIYSVSVSCDKIIRISGHTITERNGDVSQNHTEVISGGRPKDMSKSDPLQIDPVKAYKTINNYLVDHIQSDNPELNVRGANDWLSRLKVDINSHPRTLVEALGNLTTLKTIADEKTSCNHADLDLLKAFDEGTEGRSRRPVWTVKTVMRRVDKLGNHFIKIYAQGCRKIHAISLIERQSQLDKDLVERVNSITNIILNDEYSYDLNASRRSHLLYNSIIGRGSVSGGTSQAIRGLILTLAKDDPDRMYLNGTIDEREGRIVVDETKVKGLYDTYIKSPCERFVTRLEDILEHEDFLTNWFKETDQGHLEFYLVWYRYNQCRHNVIERPGLVRALVDSARDQAKESSR